METRGRGCRFGGSTVRQLSRIALGLRPLIAFCTLLEVPSATCQVQWGEVGAEQKVSALAGALSSPPTLFSGFGGSAACIGDLDGDGVQDVAVGAPYDSDGGVEGQRFGAVWILFLNTDGTVKTDQKISALSGGFAGLLADGDEFGRSLTAIGDLDQDGTPDLAAASSRSEGGSVKGSIWVLFLNPDGTLKGHQKINDVVGGFTGELDQFDGFGSGLSWLGDLDGDGRPEVAAGAPFDSDGGPARGAVWILSLNLDGTVFRESKIGSIAGLPPAALDNGDLFGASCAAVGDVDGDGIADLAVGAPHDDDGGFDYGAVWLLMLYPDGSVGDTAKISSVSGAFEGTLSDSYSFGSQLSALGDFDGNGIPDLAVGASRDDDGCSPGICGAVWLLFLHPDGSVKFTEKISQAAGGFGGSIEGGDDFGGSVALLGDLDGDGIGDLIVGAPGDDDGGFDLWGWSANNGAAWVLFLRPGTWSNLESGLDGTNGEPLLVADGDLEASATVAMTLTNAKPLALSYLVFGLDALFAQFKGGVLVPSPDFLLPFVVNGFGQVSFSVPWSAGVPAGFTSYYQFWIQDGAAPAGWAASNGVSGTTPSL